jgi:uncharacterized membrane protein (UPF0127 family)
MAVAKTHKLSNWRWLTDVPRQTAVFREDERLLSKVIMAGRFFTRLRGLAFQAELPPDTGLLLYPCNAIHTFWMRFPLDLVFLDRNGRVLYCQEAVIPNQILPSVKQGYYVLEAAAGFLKEHRIQYGDQLWW